jgi:hypothetical protein
MRAHQEKRRAKTIERVCSGRQHLVFGMFVDDHVRKEAGAS